MVEIIGKSNSVFNQFLAEIRDETIQKDRMRFRRNIERIGEVMAYEISKNLPFEAKEVGTPLGIASIQLPSEQPVIATILRAGLPLHHGILNYFDQADNSFISAYRKHHQDGSFEIKLEYLSSPKLDNRILILTDPMLATGASLVLTYKALLAKGKPKHTHIACVIASTEGINYAKKNLPSDVTIWVGAVDEELTAHGYIVPGLGDAGDLAFGVKE